MKNTLIGVMAVILVGGGIYYFTQNKAVAPENGMNGNVESKMPAPGMGNVDEMVVNSNDNSSDHMMDDGQMMGGGSMMAPATKSFTISGNNFAFDVTTIEVNKGDKVKITFKNTGGNHDLRVEGYDVGTKVLGNGKEETFEFEADKSGSFEYFCSVGSHRAMGMKGALIVK